MLLDCCSALKAFVSLSEQNSSMCCFYCSHFSLLCSIPGTQHLFGSWVFLVTETVLVLSVNERLHILAYHGRDSGCTELFCTHLGATESWSLALRKPSSPSLSAFLQQVKASIFPSASPALSVKMKALWPLI